MSAVHAAAMPFRAPPARAPAIEPAPWLTSPSTRIGVEISFASESQFFADITGDVGRGGGVFVATYEALSIGTSVELAFSLPDGWSVIALGRVAWSRDMSDDAAPGLGVVLTSVRPEDLARISEFCRARGPLYYDADDVI